MAGPGLELPGVGLVLEAGAVIGGPYGAQIAAPRQERGPDGVPDKGVPNIRARDPQLRAEDMAPGAAHADNAPARPHAPAEAEVYARGLRLDDILEAPVDGDVAAIALDAVLLRASFLTFRQVQHGMSGGVQVSHPLGVREPVPLRGEEERPPARLGAEGEPVALHGVELWIAREFLRHLPDIRRRACAGRGAGARVAQDIGMALRFGSV